MKSRAVPSLVQNLGLSLPKTAQTHRGAPSTVGFSAPSGPQDFPATVAYNSETLRIEFDGSHMPRVKKPYHQRGIPCRSKVLMKMPLIYVLLRKLECKHCGLIRRVPWYLTMREGAPEILLSLEMLSRAEAKVLQRRGNISPHIPVLLSRLLPSRIFLNQRHQDVLQLGYLHRIFPINIHTRRLRFSCLPKRGVDNATRRKRKERGGNMSIKHSKSDSDYYSPNVLLNVIILKTT